MRLLTQANPRALLVGLTTSFTDLQAEAETDRHAREHETDTVLALVSPPVTLPSCPKKPKPCWNGVFLSRLCAFAQTVQDESSPSHSLHIRSAYNLQDCLGFTSSAKPPTFPVRRGGGQGRDGMPG